MTNNISLPRHLVLSNNVRGLAVYSPDKPPDKEVFTWLSRKHQYRNVGIPHSLMEHPTVDLDSYKTFIEMQLPNDALETLQDAIPDTAPKWVVEALLTASAYIVPLFIHSDALESFAPFTTARLETVGELPEEQVLRHMRILGYGMLDLYEETTESGWNALQQADTHSEIAKRQSVARDDIEDNCWRLLENDASLRNTWVGGYFDILSMVPTSIAPQLDWSAAIGLGLVGGFVINPPYEA